MRRDINWHQTTTSGTYAVRVTFFGGKFKFQFKDEGSDRWDYDREPSLEDIEQLVETLERYYPRGRCTHKELLIARGLLCEYQAKQKIHRSEKNRNKPS
ncbi:MAG: hypothetical protein NZM04_05880 [Methylacidiphilales bacterium]|nr:hypothetical protein [Candidatus Methylacidiphilales bacterium]MDW8350066.1 hypothetical protein [Verrucomicrobiae bacterium]